MRGASSAHGVQLGRIELDVAPTDETRKPWRACADRQFVLASRPPPHGDHRADADVEPLHS